MYLKNCLRPWFEGENWILRLWKNCVAAGYGWWCEGGIGTDCTSGRGVCLEKIESQTAALIIQAVRPEARGSKPFKQHSNTGGGRK